MTKHDKKTYAILKLMSLAFGIYAIAVQILMRHAFPGAWFYARALASVAGTLCLLASTIKLQNSSSQIIFAGALGSITLLVAMIELLVEITPIAQENNDSGEIFWFFAIPMIVFFCQASVAYFKVVEKRSERLMQV